MRKSLNVYCIQHVSFEGPGVIETWAKNNGHNFSFIKLFADYKFPQPEDIDMLIVMGGPMSFDDEAKYSWMQPELDFIKTIINNNKSVLGICLGAQFIAKAIQNKAKHSTNKEIGWHNITINTKALNELSIYTFPKEMNVFHWHGDTFDIPDGAIHLASSNAFPNQAYIYNKKVIGLQFHLEVTPELVKTMVEFCKDDITPEQYEYVQDVDTIISEMKCFGAMNLCMNALLDYLEKQCLTTP